MRFNAPSTLILPLALLFLTSLATRFAQAETFSTEDRQLIQSTVKRFMDDYEVPGLSIAISKGGRLVFAAGFGTADKSTGQQVNTNHRFRIASLSKPITSIAIHKLIQQKRLAYEMPVFGPQSILGTEYGTQPYSDAVKQITLEHLLTHTVGGWGNKGRDPMFMHPEFSHDELISWTLDNQPLTKPPGREYAYSNFGYCVLGRIIERITSQTYQDFVVKQILRPIGAKSFELAGNELSDRLPDEVEYYMPNADAPYRMNVTRMDAHGGWIATPTDLVKLAVHYDGFPSPRDRMAPFLLKHMVTPSRINGGYAKGWSVNQSNNWWHTGSLPGTGAVLVRASNGHCWAVLVNTRSKKEGFFRALDKLPWDIINLPLGFPNRKREAD